MFKICLFSFFSMFTFSSLSFAKFVDKKIVVPYSKVNGLNVYSKQEEKDLTDKLNIVYSTSAERVDVERNSEETLEVNISTILVSFDSFSDFESCKTKSGLSPRIKNLKTERDFWSYMGDNSKVSELDEMLGWLKSYYSTLP